MAPFDPDQARSDSIELSLRSEIKKLTSALTCFAEWSVATMISWSMLTMPFVNWNVRAERNGYYLSVDLDFREMKKDYICRKMTRCASGSSI